MKRKSLIVCISSVILLAVAGTFMIQGESVAAETMSVTSGEVKQYVEDTAVVKCKDVQTVYIEGAGKINQINFDVGSIVKKEDLLLVMDDADLQLQLKEAGARIEAAEAQIASTDISHYTIQIEIAYAALSQAEIANSSALRALENASALYEAGAISNEEFNRAQDQSKIAEEVLKAASLQLKEAEKGAPKYIRKGYVSQLEQTVIHKDTLLRSIEKQQVKSPMDGMILERLVEKNSIAAPGASAFVIGNTSSLELEANILSDDSYKFKVGYEVEIEGEFLEGAVVKGRISEIAPEAKTITSTLGVNQKRVRVLIDMMDNQALLKPGYDVDIRIITDTKKDIIAVPDSALFDYEGISSIFVIEEEKAVIKQVKKGLEGDKLIEITEGLKEGETILVKPDNNIQEGIKIKPL